MTTAAAASRRNKSRRPTSLIAVIIGIAGLAIAAMAYWYFSAPLVRIGTPVRGPAVEAVYATGVVEPVTWAKVTPQVRGRIVDLCPCEGERVARGQALGRLHDDGERARLEELEARGRFLEKDLARYQKLLESRFVSPQAYERAATEYAEVRASIAAARERLSDYTLRSPMDGVVLRRDGEVGEIVAPGDVLFWVGKPKPLWIETEVDEEDIPRVRVGQKALIKADAFPGQILQGVVHQITPKGDPVNKSYRVRVLLPEDTALMIGMTTEVNVVVNKAEDALLVPSGAVVGDRVFVVDRGRVVARDVAIGIKGERMAEVTAGLDEHSRIVLDPPASLADGARIRVWPTEDTPL